MAKKQQPMDLNVMRPAPEQRVPSPRAELPATVQTMPQRVERFGSLVQGFAGPATRLFERAE